MTESIDLDAITTTLHFHSYGIRADVNSIRNKIFPVEGSLSIKEVKDSFAEDQTSTLSLQCDGISIYVDGKCYWMTSCFADLDENRLLCMRDKDTLERIVIGKVPEFSDPMDALNKTEALLHDLAQPKDTPNV